MTRPRLVAASIAAAALLVAGVLIGPALTSQAAVSVAFSETFETPAGFYDRFDYGYSGENPWNWGNGSGAGALTSFHGDHNDACQGPDTSRTVTFGGDRSELDFEELFWHCAPGNDPAKGHLMTAVNTVGYNIAWFSPKPLFTSVNKVCWDINETTMSKRKWTQVLFVPESDATRYPAGPTVNGVQARGSGGFDLGYVNPDFSDLSGASTGIYSPNVAGFEVLNSDGGRWFQDGRFTSGGGSGGATSDKATRYKHCLENVGSNTVRFTQARPNGQQVVDVPGRIPQGPVRVVFQDDNYNPEKGENYRADVNTWHWDNIEVFTDGGTSSTTVAPTTTVRPTTTAPTTVPPTTVTTPPPTTTTTVPVDHCVPVPSLAVKVCPL